MILFTHKASETLGIVDFFIDFKEFYFAIFLKWQILVSYLKRTSYLKRRLLIKSNITLERKRLEEMKEHLYIIFLSERIFYVCVCFYAVHIHALHTCISRIVRLPRRLTFERGKRREYEGEIEKEGKRETELWV